MENFTKICVINIVDSNALISFVEKKDTTDSNTFVNDSIWFECNKNFKIKQMGSIGNNLDKKLLHIYSQGTDNPGINIYDFDSSLDWQSENILTKKLDFNSSYDDVLIVDKIMCEFS